MLLDLGVTSEISQARFKKVLNLIQKDSFYCLWIGEDLDKSHDVFVQASYALLKTPLKVATGITSIYTWNISNIARAAVCLSEIDDDRFRLGIGVGSLKILSRMGTTPQKPLQAMREATILLRKIWKGETLTFESENFHLKSYYARYGLGQKISIFFGARGLKMLELAGEIADGVILSGPKSYLRKAIETVGNGTRKAGRSEKDVIKVAWLPTIVIARKRDAELAKKVVVFVLADTPQNVLISSEIDLELTEEIKKTYKRKGIEAAARLVTDEVLRDMVFYGGAKELCDVFLSLESYGINEVIFGPPFGADWKTAIGQVADAWRKVR